MESVGEKLKSVRTSRSCSLDQAANDTHISKKFLQALEEENFSSLPGDSYVIGFMRSYSEYLGLDSEEMIALYHNMKLQEQPAPLNELIVKAGMPGFVKILLFVLVLGGVGTAAYFIFGGNKQESDVLQEPKVVEVVPQQELAEDVFLYNTPTLATKFKEDQTIRLVLDGKNTDFFFSQTDAEPVLNVADTKVKLPLGVQSPVDLNNDGVYDIKILVGAVDVSKKPVEFSVSLDQVLDAPSSRAMTASMVREESATNLGETLIAARKKTSIPVAEYPVQGAISLRLTFDSPIVFRIESDQNPRIERLSQSGETVEISGQSRLRLWFANAGRVNVLVGNRSLKLGSEGEISTWEVSRQGAGRQLTFVPMY